MKNWGVLLVAFAVVVVVVAFFGVYNRMVALDEGVKAAWAQVENQLQRRLDLIPNYVETVKGYATHEREVFERVTEARAATVRAHTPKEQGEADDMLRNTLKTLFAVVENYPELKANENFLSLQRTLEDVEEQLSRSRRYYNAVVRDLNTVIKAFPSNIIASLFNIREREFYTLPSEALAEPPRVSFAR